MPVYKYRSLEEAERHLRELLPQDPLVRFAEVDELAAVLKPRKKIGRGIFRFKTLAEANEHRKAF